MNVFDQAIENREILGVRVDATSYERATAQILAWASAGLSRYVSLCTVNQIMEARDSITFADAMRQADLVTSDGMPPVWLLRRLGVPPRIARMRTGPDAPGSPRRSAVRRARWFPRWIEGRA